MTGEHYWYLVEFHIRYHPDGSCGTNKTEEAWTTCQRKVKTKNAEQKGFVRCLDCAYMIYCGISFHLLHCAQSVILYHLMVLHTDGTSDFVDQDHANENISKDIHRYRSPSELFGSIRSIMSIYIIGLIECSH